MSGETFTCSSARNIGRTIVANVPMRMVTVAMRAKATGFL